MGCALSKRSRRHRRVYGSNTNTAATVKINGCFGGGTYRREVAKLPSHEATRPKAISREFGKRALDVAISVLAIVVLAPVFMVVWIAIHLDSPGPAVFRQRRIGRDEKLFNCFKF